MRQKGHQAILVDVFCGQEEVDWEDPFPAEYDVEKAAAYIRGFNLQMAELTKKQRKNFFGPNVIDLCKKQILFSWDFMEPTGRTVSCREHLI